MTFREWVYFYKNLGTATDNGLYLVKKSIPKPGVTSSAISLRKLKFSNMFSYIFNSFMKFRKNHLTGSNRTQIFHMTYQFQFISQNANVIKSLVGEFLR